MRTTIENLERQDFRSGQGEPRKDGFITAGGRSAAIVQGVVVKCISR